MLYLNWIGSRRGGERILVEIVQGEVIHTHMVYRLEELMALAAELGLESRRVDDNRVDVRVHDAVLAFCNLPNEQDTLVGFDGTPWHSHGIVQFGTGDSTYIGCDELDILTGLRLGELLIVSRFVGGELQDRWIQHKNEPFELQYLEPSEEIRIVRLPSPSE
jgi:hypothetical protein